MWLVLAIPVVIILLLSIYSIGPTQVGLVRKRFGARLPGDNPLAFRGEAGYQAELLMPGLRFKLCLVYAVTKHPWVQVPAGQIGVVIAQVGEPAHRRQIGGVPAGIRQFQRPEDLRRKGRAEGRATAGAVAGHAGADSPRGVPGDHQARRSSACPFPRI